MLIADEDGLDILGLSVVQDSLSTTSSFKHRRFDDVAHLAELWSNEQRPRSSVSMAAWFMTGLVELLKFRRIPGVRSVG